MTQQVHKFEFKKDTVEIVEVAGKQYSIDFGDEAIRDMQVKFNAFYSDYKNLAAKETANMNGNAVNEYFDNIKELIKKITEGILGVGTFDELYAASGKSLINMMELITYLSDLIGNKAGVVREKNRAKYVNNNAEPHNKPRKRR